MVRLFTLCWPPILAVGVYGLCSAKHAFTDAFPGLSVSQTVNLMCAAECFLLNCRRTVVSTVIAKRKLMFDCMQFQLATGVVEFLVVINI